MINFEDRAVAFIDILGFKALVNKAIEKEENLSKLSELVALLQGAVPEFNSIVHKDVPKHLIPKHTYISDCIILSAPLTDDTTHDYNGLDAVIMRTIQLTHFFLNYGYLIRGGISVGKVWHTESNIVGPAYQEAYQLESKGDNPVILLSHNARATNRLPESRMCLTHDSKYFVNGLHDQYIPNAEQHGKIEETYKKYSELVDKTISIDLPDSAKEKWIWFKSYLEMESGSNLKWPEA